MPIELSITEDRRNKSENVPDAAVKMWIAEMHRILPPEVGLSSQEKDWLAKSCQRGDGALNAALAIIGGAWRLDTSRQ